MSRQPARIRSNRNRHSTVQHVRGIMGRTQAELASALGISAKAVQSYEQGWRPVPTRVLIQLMVLLALYRRQNMEDVPCWEITRCESSTRERCPSFQVGRGQFCWFIGSKACVPKGKKSPDDGLIPCMECAVIQRLLRGPRSPAEELPWK
jgi:DNA-binding XRE family transcriptional regulator